MSVPDFSIVDEMAQFASFPEATRRYICEALEIGFTGVSNKPVVGDRLSAIASRLARMDVYHSMPFVRECISNKNYNLETWSKEFGLLHRYAQFDVQYAEMSDFKAFVFLYERLLGSAIRPWLLSIYLAAAASPRITEEAREQLLSGITAFDVAHDFVTAPAPKYFPNQDEDSRLKSPGPRSFRPERRGS